MGALASKVFHGPGDWLVDRTNARTRRSINVWIFLLWLFPGGLVWALLLHSLAFVGFMSIFALWWTGWGSFSAETPVEDENAEASP